MARVCLLTSGTQLTSADRSCAEQCSALAADVVSAMVRISQQWRDSMRSAVVAAAKGTAEYAVWILRVCASKSDGLAAAVLEPGGPLKCDHA